ncbi:3-oxoadipate enol-lactonase [Occallatibacter riparius]|uniref:3-oxoadipate enol-lactonase n=1 Tax=Occallatibacter riparius TaxID=1002689 RepID=A0A9J7BX96_9BACT|nr:3-oxoadipate enol-lactonase [Occallatibacter riparius]UWZ85574.1 3-oxoadipate enol-lactonase [Occallatibacter riparius]
MPAAKRDQVQLHYKLSGRASGDLLVLSNSIGSSTRMWDKVLPAFEEQYRVLRYDTRGHGASSVPVPPYTLDQLGHDILFLLDQVGAARAHFCGLSLGGMVGQWLAINAPERLGRMILANTAARIGTQQLWEQRIATVRESGMGPLAEATLTRWFTAEYRAHHPDEMAIMRQMIASTDPTGYAACCGVLRDTDLGDAIAAFNEPCLVIAGKHDPATPPCDGQALAAALTRAEYLELDASHMSAWEQADAFAQATLSFLSGGPTHG